MVDVSLSGAQRAELRDVLISAYPNPARFQSFIERRLNVTNFFSVAPPMGDLQAWGDAWVQECRSRGRLNEVIAALRDERPGNLELLDFLKEIGVSVESGHGQQSLEKIVSENSQWTDLVAWRVELHRKEFQVARIEYSGQARGTGFLVGPDLILTNHHVLAHAIKQGSSAGWGARFDYKTAADGVAVSAGQLVELRANDWLIDWSPFSDLDTKTLAQRSGQEPDAEHLDFALIRLQREIGRELIHADSEIKRGWVEWPQAVGAVELVKGLIILQHPLGQSLKLAQAIPAQLSSNGPGTRWRYLLPTESGSSGSPVFDTEWTLRALHHSGDPSTTNPEYNEAIPIHLIGQRQKVKSVLGIGE